MARRSTEAVVPAWIAAPGHRGAAALSPAPWSARPDAEPAALVAAPPASASASNPADPQDAEPLLASPGAAPGPVDLAALPAVGPAPVASELRDHTGSTSASAPEPLWVPRGHGHDAPAGGEFDHRWRHPHPANRHSSHPAAGPVERPLASWDPVSVSEACGFAVRFAADYLSWDEREPRRRSAALRTYLADPDLAEIGWSGHGRQRTELVTAGRTVILGEGRVVVVEVTARVVVYHRVDHTDPALPTPSEVAPALAFAPASAPAPIDAGWRPGASWWMRIAPPVRRDDNGQLVVDVGLDLTTQS